MSRFRLLGAAAAALCLLVAGAPSVSAAPASGSRSAFVFAGTWQDNGSTAKHSWTAGSTATAAVQVAAGSTVSLTTDVGPAQGRYSASVDGGTAVVRDGYASGWTRAATLFTSAPLAAGCHMVRLTVLGQKAPASSGQVVVLRSVNVSNGSILPAGSTCAPTPPAGDRGAQTLAALTLPAPGFFSGYSGGDPAAFRGQATSMRSTWHDEADGGAWDWGPSDATLAYRGYVDVAPGGPSDWAAAAGGSMDAAWRTYMQQLRAARTVDGVVQPTSVRLAHELNGTWYPWSVSASEVADFQATVKRLEGIADTAFPEAIFALAFNGDSIGGVTPWTYLNGLQGVVDAIGVDYYNQWPYIGTARDGTHTTWADGANRGTVDNPRGLLKWDALATQFGVPYYLPEWANNGDAQGGTQSGDDPLFVRGVYAHINGDAGTGPGRPFAEAWFNYQKEHEGWHVCCQPGPTEQPVVAQAYADLFPMP